MKKVDLYTDGACRGNPGRGGIGAVLEYKGAIMEISRGFRLTTNNRMEILAVIEGLSALKEPCEVTLYSDSKYVVDALNKGWIEKWKSKGWRKADGKPALNVDLWQRLLKLLAVHKTEVLWVKGHNGHGYNERCDYLATSAADGGDLERDEEFEKNSGRI